MGAPSKAVLSWTEAAKIRYSILYLVFVHKTYVEVGEVQRIEFQDHGPKGKDLTRHIADQISKGSALCPFGSAAMGSSFKTPDYDPHGYDPNAPDSDDEPLSDISEM